MEALNEKMGLRLAHHDMNWCYNLQLLKGKSYYLKTRDDRVRLIQCLPESSKGFYEDFLIVSGEWHDSLHCPTTEGTPGGAVGDRKGFKFSSFFFALLFFFFFFTDAVVFFVRRPARLSASLPSGQPRRFAKGAEGTGVYKRGRQSG